MFRAAIFAVAFAAAAGAPYNTIIDSVVSPAAVNASDKFDLAETAAGGLILLWRNAEAPFTMYAQSHGADGAELSSVQVAEGIAADNMAVAGLENGGFVAVFSAGGSTTVRVYDSSSALVTAFTVYNSATAARTSNADVTSLTDGRFTVTWEEQATALSGWCIYVRTFTAAGATSGNILQVSDTVQATETRQYYPTIANIDGSYVVTYAGETNVYARYGSSSSLESTITVDADGTNANTTYTRCASKIANWWTDTAVMTYAVDKGTYNQLYLRDIKTNNRYHIANSLEGHLQFSDTAGFKASGQRGYIAVYATPYNVRGMVFNYWGSVDDIFIVGRNYVQTNYNVRVVGLGGAAMDAGVVYQTTIDDTTRLILTRLNGATFGPFSIHL